MSTKIYTVEIENAKRVKAVALEPSENGLTIIGGNNGQGKTSVLDAICWALGGDRYKPSNPTREGSTVPPRIKLTLSNGLVVERAGKNSALKVSDPTGRKGGQQLLNEFVSVLALDLPKFMEAGAKEKAETLLQIIGVGPELHRLEQAEAETYNQRTLVGRERDRKKLFAEGLPWWPEAPAEPVSISDLIRQQQEILARNGENQRKRDRLNEITFEKHRIYDEIERLEAQAEELARRIAERKEAYQTVARDEEIARKDALELHDESTEALERQIADFEAVNKQVRDNMDRSRAMDEAKVLSDQYDALTGKVEELRQQKADLLNGAKLPLPGLGVEDGELVYNGAKWDCMSGSQRLKVAAAIVRAVKPECGFVLVDSLEQMDIPTLKEFGQWAEREGLQIIGTRVSTGDECSVIITDGQVEQAEPQPAPTWKAGVF